MTYISSANSNTSAVNANRDALAYVHKKNPLQTNGVPVANHTWLAGPVTYKRSADGGQPVNPDDQMRTVDRSDAARPPSYVIADRYASEEKLIGNLSREVQTRAAAVKAAQAEYDEAEKALKSQGGVRSIEVVPSFVTKVTKPGTEAAQAKFDGAKAKLDGAIAEHRSASQLLDRAINMVPPNAGSGASDNENTVRHRDALMRAFNVAVAAEKQAEQALTEGTSYNRNLHWVDALKQTNGYRDLGSLKSARDAARVATAQASALLTGFINADVRTASAPESR